MAEQTRDGEERRLGPLNLNYGALNVTSTNGLSDLRATLSLFQNSTTIPSGALSVGQNGNNYSISYSGGLPLQGNFGPFAMEGLSADNIAIGRSGLQNFSVSADAMKIGENFQLENINAVLRGDRGNFRVTAAAASGSIMGYEYSVVNPTMVIDRNGNFVSANFGAINSEQFTASGGRVTPEGVEITSAGVDLPEIYGQTLKLSFANLNIGSGGVSGTGQVKQESELKLAGETLTVSGFTGTANIENNNWNVNVNGNINYNNAGTNIQATANVTYGNGMGNLSISSGSVNASLNGISFASEGMSYDSASDKMLISNTSVSVPILNSTVQGNVSNAEFGPEGFDFETVTLSSGLVDLFPGMQMAIGTATVAKEGSNYTFAMENGQVSYSTASVSGSGTISVWYDSQGFRGKIMNPTFNSNFLDITGAGEINFTDTGISIPTAQLNVKNLGAAAEALSVTAGGIEYGSEGLQVNSLDVVLPPIGDLNAKAHVDNIAIGEGINASGGIVQVDGEMSFAGGAFTVNDFSSEVGISESGWNITTTGQLGVTTPNVTATGNVTANYTAGAEPTIEIAEGQLVSEIAGIKLTASGLSFNSSTLTAAIDNIDVEIEKLNEAGASLEVSGSGFEFGGTEGFTFSEISVQTAGEVELLPGLVVPEFVGYLRKDGTQYSAEMLGSVNFNNPVLSGGAENITYNYNNGDQSFSIEGLNIDSNFFSLNAGSSTYADGVLNIENSDFQVKNLGDMGEAASVSVGNIQWSESGLDVNNLDVSLPQIGDVTVTGHADNININEGVTVQGGTVSAGGQISFAGGGLTLNNVNGTFNILNNAWDASISGALGVNVPNTTASGNLTIAFGSSGTEFNLENGQIQSTLAGLTITATGISFGSDTSTLMIDTAVLEVPELNGGDLQATISQVSFGPDGFDFQSVSINSTGSFELLPGFSVSGIAGTLTKEGGGEYGIDAQMSANFQTASLQGGASVHFTRSGGASRFEVSQLNIQSNLFDFSVETAVYENNKLSIAAANLDLKNLGSAGDGVQANATGIEYSSRGLTVEHLEADFPKIGTVDVKVLVDGLNIASGGGITGRGTVEVGAEFNLADGAATLSNVSGTVDFSENDWGVSVSGGLGFNVPNVSGGGQVTISYSGAEGVNVAIENGSLSANFPGVAMTGSGIGFNYAEDEFTVDTTTISMPKLGQNGLNTTVEGLSIKDGDIDFQSIIIQVNQTFTIIDGLSGTLESGELSKEGASMTASITMSVDVNDSNFGIGGSGRGTMSYELGSGDFSGSLDSLSLNTSVFDIALSGGVEIGADGMHIGQASLSFSEDFDKEELKRMIPQAGELGSMALNALKGVRVSATDINYTQAEGFSIGDWSLEFAKIGFDVLGIEGELDLANLSASLSGEKTFSLDDFNIPTSIGVDVPIVPGINATGRIGLGASISIGADISAQGDKDSDVWMLRGGLDVSGDLTAYLQLGIEADAVLASAGAALRASINAGLDASAGIGMGITYDSETNSVALADRGLTFDYSFLAEIFSRLDLVLEYEVLFGLFGGEEIIELDRWDIGNFVLRGQSVAENFGEIFDNMESTKYFEIDGERYDL
jgi:hypothetical protein